MTAGPPLHPRLKAVAVEDHHRLAQAHHRPATPAVVDADLDADPLHRQAVDRALVDLRSRLRTPAQMIAMPPPEPLLEGILMRDTLAQLWGAPGTGKSFLALAWSCHLATGLPWGDVPVRQSTVLYVAAEGAVGTGARIAAWQEHHGTTVEPHRLPFIEGAVQLNDPYYCDGLTELVLEVGAELVVVDTRARCTVGVEENSNTDMGVIVHRLEAVRMRTGATILLVHHSNAGGDKDRGATVVLGAVETSLCVVGDKLEVKKQKNARDDLSWNLQRLEVGQSLVVLPGGTARVRDKNPPHPRSWDVKAAVVELYAETGKGLARADIFERAGITSTSTGEKALKWLVDHNHVHKADRGLYVPAQLVVNP